MELVPDENDRKEFLFCNCAKHRAGLIKKHFGKSAEKIFWEAIKAGTEEKLQIAREKAEQLQRGDPDAEIPLPPINKKVSGRTLVEYLFGDGERFFPCKVDAPRFGITSSQGAESLNSAPGTSRSPHGGGFLRYMHPVFCCLGYYIWYLERIKHMKNELARKNSLHETLTKSAQAALQESLAAAERLCEVMTPVGNLRNDAYRRQADQGALVLNDEFDTERTTNLRHHTCTCGKFQESGIPCKHACAVASKIGERPDKFVNRRFFMKHHVNMLKQTGVDTCTSGVSNLHQVPDWSIIHAVVETGGAPSQEVLKRIHKQCPRGMTFDEFLECWRNAEAPPPPKPPAHDELVKLCSVPGCGDGPKMHYHCTKCTLNTTHCHCAFCDNKQSYTRPGRKKRKRLTGVAM